MSSKIGERVRGLRKAAGMTKEQLAVASSVDGEVLERIEKENMNPSVPVLTRICSALGTRAGTVLDGAEFAGPVHTAADDGASAAKSDFVESNLKYHLLACRKSDRNMEPSIVEVGYAPADAPGCAPREGEEFLYVLDGSVTLRYGCECYELRAGDSIYFDSCVPHALSTDAPDARARILAISYMPSA